MPPNPSNASKFVFNSAAMAFARASLPDLPSISCSENSLMTAKILDLNDN